MFFINGDIKLSFYNFCINSYFFNLSVKVNLILFQSLNLMVFWWNCWFEWFHFLLQLLNNFKKIVLFCFCICLFWLICRKILLFCLELILKLSDQVLFIFELIFELIFSTFDLSVMILFQRSNDLVFLCELIFKSLNFSFKFLNF